MSGHSVQTDGTARRNAEGEWESPLRVTIMLDRSDQAPASLDRIMDEVRQTIDRYIEARKR